MAAGCLAAMSQPLSYDIRDFGAKADGSLCTEAINKAIATASGAGGGKVVIPAGTFTSGTIFMKDHVELHLSVGAVLSASLKHCDYPRQVSEYRALREEQWFALIYAEKVSDIAITGFGTITGNGQFQEVCETCPDKQFNERPRNILFISCKNIRVKDVTLISSCFWNQHYLDCEDVIVDGIQVYNHPVLNEDAIDIDGCRRFVLANAILDSSDDAIAIKSTGVAPAEDIVITNCVVSSYVNAIKAGTESTGGFRNISISNCVIKPSRADGVPSFMKPRRTIGITGISLEIVDGGVMEGVSISNVTIEGTECPLYLRLANRGRKHVKDAPAPPMGKMRNIIISNVTAYNTGNFSNSITSIPGSYIENVTIRNVQLFSEGGVTSGGYIPEAAQVNESIKGYPQPTVWKQLPSSVWFVRHVKNLSISDLMFGCEAVDPRPPFVMQDVRNVRIGQSVCAGGIAEGVPYAVLEDVTDYEIEKPLGWGKAKLIEVRK
jgi:polygalacturonase